MPKIASLWSHRSPSSLRALSAAGLVVTGAAFAFGGCGSDPYSGTVTETDGGPDVNVGGDSGAPANGDAGGPIDSGPVGPFALSFPSFSIKPGVEQTKCVVLDLGNDAPVKIGEIHDTFADQGFRLVVSKTTAAAQPAATDCQPLATSFSPKDVTPLVISQAKDDDLTLPPDVAFSFDAHQLIMLELQAVNGTMAPAAISATVTFTTSPTATHAAGFALFTDIDIQIAAAGTETVSGFLPLNPSLASAQFFSYVGYTQSHGTGVMVSTGPSAGPFATAYDSTAFEWSHPTRESVTPAALADGSGFKLTCMYDNMGGSAPLTFGRASSNEICAFGAYYYEAVGAIACLHSDKVAADICCPSASTACSGF